MNEANAPLSVYLFVVWNRGLPELDYVLGELRKHFTVLRQFDVRWRPRDFVRNFAAFYGWRAFAQWVGKKHRSGTGPFRVIVVRDEHPMFRASKNLVPAELNPVPEELAFNEKLYDIKVRLRKTMKHTNVVHATDCEAETRHNLKALTGETLEEFLARKDLGDKDGPFETIAFDEPMPYVAYRYAEAAGKGSRYADLEFRFNRVAIFLLPRCGVPTIFSFSFRLFGIFSFAFCIGKIKMGFRQSIS